MARLSEEERRHRASEASKRLWVTASPERRERMLANLVKGRTRTREDPQPPDPDPAPPPDPAEPPPPTENRWGVLGRVATATPRDVLDRIGRH